MPNNGRYRPLSLKVPRADHKPYLLVAFETLALLTSPNDDGEFMLALFVAATAALLEIALAWPPTPALLAATLDVTLEL